jgi:oligopeptide transport system substrate-binding protein
MRKASNLLLVGIVAVLLGALVIVPVMAQEVGPGEGGIIIDSAVGTSGADTLNPIFCLDVICDAVVGLMVPSLIAVDPQEGVWKVGIPGALAESAELSDDNLVWTFHLRDDMFWADGATAKDAVRLGRHDQLPGRVTFYRLWIRTAAPDDQSRGNNARF